MSLSKRSLDMRIAWERIATVVLSVGVWTAVLIGGRHMAHLLRGDVHELARIAIASGRFA